MPTFPNARYLLGRAEFDHWRAQREREDMTAVFGDSVAPIHDAGLVDLVETDHRLCDEISLIPTLGHTPGHVSVRISSRGEEALITGDFMHHPCQIAQPDWASAADSDPDEARRTRERMFGELCGHAGPGDRHAFRRRDGRSYRARRRHVPAGGVTALPPPLPIGIYVFCATALLGLRLWMWPLSVPAVGSITALISAGLPEASASVSALVRLGVSVTWYPLPPNASMIFS